MHEGACFIHIVLIYLVYTLEKEITVMQRTNIELDERLVQQTLKLTHLKTKKELLNYALEELLHRLKRRKLLELEGKVNWIGDLDKLRESRV